MSLFSVQIDFLMWLSFTHIFGLIDSVDKHMALRLVGVNLYDITQLLIDLLTH